jgi:hypothetical protein
MESNNSVATILPFTTSAVIGAYHIEAGAGTTYEMQVKKEGVSVAATGRLIRPVYR